MAVLEVRNLIKSYAGRNKSRLIAVNDISFDVGAGEVVGFIGPNGAGKSTALKIITGLAAADSGTVKIEGHDIVKERIPAMKNVGAIVENPDLYLEWSALENLRYLARISRIELPEDMQGLTVKEITEKRIEELLSLVGLSARKTDKVKKYSLGMKQRLGIAQALLSRPKLLILDEPNNGLDPSGILEMRSIISHLANELNIAVLISSHQLAEMESLCDRFLIINKGKLIETPAKEALQASSEGASIVVATDNIVGARDVLKEKFDITAELRNGTVEFRTAIDTGEITKELIMSGINVKGISRKEISLEEIFIKATEKRGR